MSEKRLNVYTNGTSALKMPRFSESYEDAKIIAFPSSRVIPAAEKQVQVESRIEENSGNRAIRAIRHVLESSEMYCSLRYESMLGCPYRLFSKRGVEVLSVGASLIGLLSLILGS